MAERTVSIDLTHTEISTLRTALSLSWRDWEARYAKSGDPLDQRLAEADKAIHGRLSYALAQMPGRTVATS